MADRRSKYFIALCVLGIIFSALPLLGSLQYLPYEVTNAVQDQRLQVAEGRIDKIEDLMLSMNNKMNALLGGVIVLHGLLALGYINLRGKK